MPVDFAYANSATAAELPAPARTGFRRAPQLIPATWTEHAFPTEHGEPIAQRVYRRGKEEPSRDLKPVRRINGFVARISDTEGVADVVYIIRGKKVHYSLPLKSLQNRNKFHVNQPFEMTEYEVPGFSGKIYDFKPLAREGDRVREQVISSDRVQSILSSLRRAQD